MEEFGSIEDNIDLMVLGSDVLQGASYNIMKRLLTNAVSGLWKSQ